MAKKIDGSNTQRWPAGQVLSDALIGMELGFIPYKLKVMIADLAETRVIYPWDPPPDLPPLFRKIEELIAQVGLATHRESRRTEATEALADIEQHVRRDQFRAYFSQLWREANAEARKQAETQQWKGGHRYLQAWLAVHPEVSRRELEGRFDLWYLDALASTEPRKQPRTKVSEQDRKLLDAEGPQPQTGEVNVPVQWDIAMANAQAEWRQGVVQMAEGEGGTLLDRLSELLAEANPVVRHWAKIGELLGRIHWASWCPVADEFAKYVPKSLSELVAFPEAGMADTQAFLKNWKNRFAAAKPSPWPEPEEENAGSRRSSWTEHLAAWSASKFEFLLSVLQSMKECVGDVDRLDLSVHIPPALAVSEKRYVVLGHDGSKQLPFTTFAIIEALQRLYPDGATLKGLDPERHAHKYLQRLSADDPQWARVLRFPGVKGRGGYRLVWPV